MFSSFGLLGKCLMFIEAMCLGREIADVASINKEMLENKSRRKY